MLGLPRLVRRRSPLSLYLGEDNNLDLVKSLGGRVKSVYRFQPAIAAEMPEAVVDALGRNLLNSMSSVAYGDLGIEICLVYFLLAQLGTRSSSGRGDVHIHGG